MIVGPRRIKGWFGHTFFDPVNLVCVSLLLISAVLVVVSMKGRGAPDWYMSLGLYLCLFTFLRGYIFNYYYGRRFGRVVVLVILLIGITGSAALWEDRSVTHEVIRDNGIFELPKAQGFHLAALLHITCAVALLAHIIVPRRWLIRVTGELVESTGQELPSESLAGELDAADIIEDRDGPSDTPTS
jgi:xanthine/uracil permease